MSSDQKKSKLSILAIVISITAALISITTMINDENRSDVEFKNITLPEIVELKEIAANQFFEEGRFNETIEVTKQIIKLSPNNRDVLLLQGHAYTEQNYLNKAINSYMRILDEIYDHDVISMQSIGDVYMQQSNYDSALTWFDKAIDVNDLAPYPKIRKADALSALGQCKLAVILYNTVISSKELEHGDYRTENIKKANIGKEITLQKQKDGKCLT